MSALLIDCQYFGSINYYKLLFQNKYIIFEQYDKHQKASFKNRCLIPGANGVVSLSVPLEKGRDQKAITKDIKISYRDNWVQQHIRTLESVYNRAPFFEYYRDELKTLLERKPLFLLDLNIATTEWISEKFGGGLHISLTESYQPLAGEGEIDGRGRFSPRLNITNHTHPYTQVFEDKIGYQSNMSILDLLSCTGKAGYRLLVDSKNVF
ncbi:MAG: WbqC family protein [Sediminibacterium sp.]|nr:WbqC family protein [Sediminibacterium sp.]MBX9781112.1 WbqC family protein [Chitinophagaceae bacterium]